MVEIIGEFSAISKFKVIIERTYPGLYERCFIHPGMAIHDQFNHVNTNKLIDAWNGEIKDIHIETLNRCNGHCEFCPTSRDNDPRPYTLMEESLFLNIINQLKEMDYKGQVSIQSNNEPLLDGRILRFIKIAKRNLPDAQHIMFTNGSLLTVEKLDTLLCTLNHLWIDNYNYRSEFNNSTKMVLEYLSLHPEHSDKVTVLVTRPDARRNNRGGLSKNRIPQQLKSPCIYPFMQMVIRPDGKTSLCCNDGPGRMTMADLNLESIHEAWVNVNYRVARAQMKNYGRQEIEICKNCDTCLNGLSLITDARKLLGGIKHGH